MASPTDCCGEVGIGHNQGTIVGPPMRQVLFNNPPHDTGIPFSAESDDVWLLFGRLTPRDH